MYINTKKGLISLRESLSVCLYSYLSHKLLMSIQNDRTPAQKSRKWNFLEVAGIPGENTIISCGSRCFIFVLCNAEIYDEHFCLF